MKAGGKQNKIRRVDVAGVGLNATDTILRVPHFPAFDSKVNLLSDEVRAGGQVASAMVACQKWGLTTRYIGKVGDDSAADFQREQLRAAGVEAHLFRVKKCRSQIAYIIVDAQSGERTILWQHDARLEVKPEELKRDWINNASALLVDGHDTKAAAQAARWARAAGIPVVADIDDIYDGLQALLENVDFLISSKGFHRRLTGEKDLLGTLIEVHARYRQRATGATFGRHGAVAWDGKRFHYSPGYAVRAVDTTGAGDIFHGAFVYGVVRGWELGRTLDFSCAAAALACTAVGARAGIASLAEIENLMRKGRRNESAFASSELEKHTSLG